MRLSVATPLAGAVLACAVAALAASTPTSMNVFMPNRTFGLGEQHVYVIERSQSVVVRYRNADGDLVRKTLTRSDSHSVALTVEGYASDGSAVVAVAGDAQASGAAFALAPASPTINAKGAIAGTGPLAQLGAAALIIGSAPSTGLTDGAKWNGDGPLALPYGAVNARIANSAASWNDDPGVLQVTSVGTVDTRGTVDVAGFGKATLRGNGSCNATSYIDLTDDLVLGSTFTVASHGNAVNKNGDAGTYTFTGTYTLKLASYGPGRTPVPSSAPSTVPGFSQNAAPDTDVIRQGAGEPVAQPAPTDTFMSGSPLPVMTPGPMPTESMPPVPVSVSRGAPLASPPAPPPTPYPTITPH